MDVSERRVIGALLLVLGASLLAVGIYSKQLDALVELLKTSFRL